MGTVTLRGVCDRGYTVYRDDEDGEGCVAMRLESGAFSQSV